MAFWPLCLRLARSQRRGEAQVDRALQTSPPLLLLLLPLSRFLAPTPGLNRPFIRITRRKPTFPKRVGASRRSHPHQLPRYLGVSLNGTVRMQRIATNAEPADLPAHNWRTPTPQKNLPASAPTAVAHRANGESGQERRQSCPGGNATGGRSGRVPRNMATAQKAGG